MKLDFKLGDLVKVEGADGAEIADGIITRLSKNGFQLDDGACSVSFRVIDLVSPVSELYISRSFKVRLNCDASASF